VDPDLNTAERLAWETGLLERARRGDRNAFSEIYRAYAPALFTRVLMPKLGDKDLAADALGETFRVAFERLESFEPRGVSLYFWISRIAANKATDLHRARAVTSRALAAFESLVVPLGEMPLDPGELFELRTDTTRLSKAVTHVLERLNPRYRRAVELRFVEELPREECATALDVKLGTFDVLLLRALRAFRKEWTLMLEEKEAT
jgi:RNA polymerase sigma factor (sigma-70 family)